MDVRQSRQLHGRATNFDWRVRMASRYPLTIDGVNYSVEVDQLDAGFSVSIDGGEPILLDVALSGVPGLMSLIGTSGNWQGYVVPTSDGWRVTSNNKTLDVQNSQAARKQRGSSTTEDPPGKISAPLAGVLTEIRVQVGDVVAEGQTVAVIEAMKMQNEIKIPSAGKITAVHIEAGGRAEKSDLIIEYEVSD